jgi:hypothetical protein
MAGPGDHGPFIESECFRDDEQQKTFHKRLRLLKANRYDPAHFSPGTLNMVESYRCGVRLPELSAWANGIGWTLPAGFPAPATPEPALPAPKPSMVAALLRRSMEVAGEHSVERYRAQLRAAEVRPHSLPAGAAEATQPATASVEAAQPLKTTQIAIVFDGLRYTAQQWKKPLGDKPKWLEACIAVAGEQGVRQTLWNPVLIGAALVRAGHVTARSVRARFQTQQMLKPWLEDWKTYEADNFEKD